MNKLRGILDFVEGRVQVDGLEEWTRIGKRLALVDRGRFLKLLGVAEAIVAVYETNDPESAVRERLPALKSLDESCDA